MTFFFQNTKFNITVAKLEALDKYSLLPEIAFIGRSNAGKSSAINALTHQRKLAHISKMPGRTQNLNFFSVIRPKEEVVGYLVDLPGYGYAKTSKSIRNTWDGFLGIYLLERPQLQGLVMVMDSRHPMTDLDQRTINWFAQTHKPIYILLTKCDKLTYNDKHKAKIICQEKLQALNLKNTEVQMQLFSSSQRIGITELSTKLQDWIAQLR